MREIDDIIPTTVELSVMFKRMMADGNSYLSWYHSKVTLSPAAAVTLEGATLLATLQMMSVEETSFTGELLGGERM